MPRRGVPQHYQPEYIDPEQERDLVREDQEQREIEAAEMGGEYEPVAAGPLPELASTAEVARYLRRKPKTIRRYIAEGKLPAKGGKHSPYRVKREDVLALTAAEPRSETPRQRSRRARPSGGRFAGLEGKDR